MTDDKALTPQEVADILKIAKNTVYELIKRGELSAYRVGNKVRVDMKDIENYKGKTKNFISPSTPEDRQLSVNPPISYQAVNEDSYMNNNMIICGQDIILDILSRHLEVQNIHTLRSYAGSYNGLYDLYQGKAQIATCHLWDSDSNTYNIPYVRRMLPGISSIIIHLAVRTQGFYVTKGNPKKILNWNDLNRNDIKIINREKGSGTRVLLDEKLKQLGIPGYKIMGYNYEATSHLAIASSVSRGEADLGIGNQKTSLQVSGIDFIPLQKERYELVMKKEDYGKPQFNSILNILRSSEFKSEIKGIGDYDISEMGQIVAEI